MINFLSIVQFDQQIWGPTEELHIAKHISWNQIMFNFYNKTDYKISDKNMI